MNRKRREDETFEDYKKSMKIENLMSKFQARGKVIWDSKNLGKKVGSFKP